MMNALLILLVPLALVAAYSWHDLDGKEDDTDE